MTDPDELFADALGDEGDLQPEPADDDVPGRPDDPADVVRAIEAIVLVASDPVPPDLLAQLLELPVATIEQLCQRLAEAYE
jgi:hypothetical protein